MGLSDETGMRLWLPGIEGPARLTAEAEVINGAVTITLDTPTDDGKFIDIPITLSREEATTLGKWLLRAARP